MFMDDLEFESEGEGEKREKSAKEISEEIGEDPNNKWWNGLSEDQKKEFLRVAVAEKIGPDAVRWGEKISYKPGKDLLFAAAKVEAANYEDSIIYKTVHRVHFVPNAKEANLTEEASAEFIYNRIDQQRLGFPDPELPTVVHIIRQGEASMHKALTPEKTVNGSAQMGENDPIPC